MSDGCRMSDVELMKVEIKIYAKVLYCNPFPKVGDGSRE